jgi:hypothetical protein
VGVMVLERNGRPSPVSMNTCPRSGDSAIVALDTAGRDQAREALRASGWQLSSAEPSAAVVAVSTSRRGPRVIAFSPVRPIVAS